MSKEVVKARMFAEEAHKGQKYGEEPYIVHLDAVAAIVEEYGDVAQTIAYLHDTVEDTEASVEDIRKFFGDTVADSVSMLTDEPGANRKELKANTNFKLAQASGHLGMALVVKAADRLANVREGTKNDMYRKEHEDFRSAVWRFGVATEIWLEIDETLS